MVSLTISQSNIIPNRQLKSIIFEACKQWGTHKPSQRRKNHPECEQQLPFVLGEMRNGTDEQFGQDGHFPWNLRTFQNKTKMTKGCRSTNKMDILIRKKKEQEWSIWNPRNNKFFAFFNHYIP